MTDLQFQPPEALPQTGTIPWRMNGEWLDEERPFEVFHEASKWWRKTSAPIMMRINAYLTVPKLIEQSRLGFKRFLGDSVDLPAPAPAAMTLGDALDRRVSERRFAAGPISLRALSDILHAAAAARRVTTEKRPLYSRPYPSAGGLYPVEVYVIFLAVEGMPPGVYNYDARHHKLRPVLERLAVEEVTKGIETLPATNQAAAIIVLSAVFQRCTVKYGERGYRFALLEAGHLSQNICLAAEAVGYGSLAWGAYYDDEVNVSIAADGVTESIVAMLFLGAHDAEQA
jgi:SagB-type dehydrogenase family enzyme